ncbi:hypothetical protein C010_01720 [Brucella ovis 80/125]|nr:hypothetical protein C010_01720 [Brucella ovis 80/125]ENS94231.1 hypothetical protein B999_02042 [Brucella ovis 63/96]SUW43482.1 leucine-, isoleucine-, valine-, threonine-, and alanine-binding protein precursor [Brucella ovis]
MKKSLFCGVCLCALVAMGGTSFADIMVGVGALLTGSQAAFGEQIKRGVEAAVAEANAKGGMNGEQITLVYMVMTLPIPSRASRLQTSSWAMASSL